MAMQIRIEWQKPVRLWDGSEENLVYTVEDINKIPKAPGIYVFARKRGDEVSPLYIGRGKNLRARIEDHLYGNVELMLGIKKAPKGRRMLLLGKLLPQPGQTKDKALDVAERAYIENAMSQGYDLLNESATKTPVHTVESKGKKAFHRPFPRRMKRRTK